MNCPNCGTDTVPDQQYCRGCGAGLIDGERRQFNFQAWGLLALMLIFGGLLVAMGGKIWAVKWVIFTGLIIMFSGVFGIAAYGIIRQTRPRKRPRTFTPAQEPQTLGADTTRKLPPLGLDDLIPSVVEDTTELLKTPAARKAALKD